MIADARTSAVGTVIDCIPRNVDAHSAEQILKSALPGFRVATERELYYPYFRCDLSYTARTALGRTRFRLKCLVDARKNIGATADAFEVAPLCIDRNNLLDPRIERGDAERTARRYSAYVLRRKHKALVRPEVDVEALTLVHKPFSLLQCARDDCAPLEVIVDGVTGGFHWL